MLLADDPDTLATRYGLQLTVYEEAYCLCPFCAFRAQCRRDGPGTAARLRHEILDHIRGDHLTELVARLRH